MDSNLIWIPIIIVVLAGAIGLFFSKEKPDELALLAGRLQLSFMPDEDYSIPSRFEFLDGFDEGSNRYAFNVLSGEYHGQEVLAFDYHYETKTNEIDGRTGTWEHEFGVLILFLPAQFPELTITSEDLFEKMERALGSEDINFESAEFSKAFCVKSPDKKFAYDVCNPSMMEYLLANQDIGLEIERNVIAMEFSGSLSAQLVEFNLQRLESIRLRMPDYLFTKV